MVQWLGTRLPIQETWFQSLVWEGPWCLREAKPRHHNYWRLSGAGALQQAKPPRWEACSLPRRAAPLITARESPHGNEDRRARSWLHKELLKGVSTNKMLDFGKHHLKDFFFRLDDYLRMMLGSILPRLGGWPQWPLIPLILKGLHLDPWGILLQHQSYLSLIPCVSSKPNKAQFSHL